MYIYLSFVVYLQGRILTMTATGGSGDMCSSKVRYLKLCILFLVCTTIYVYLYSSITVQTFAIGKVMKGTIHDIQRWRNKMEGWVQMMGRASDKKESSRTKQTIKSVIRGLNNTTMTDNESSEMLSTMVQRDFSNNGSNTTYESNVVAKPKPEVLLTLFSSWPTKAEKYLCHNNTLRNWALLKPLIQPVVFTNETSLAEKAIEMGWGALPVRKAGRGVPILKYMYQDVKEIYRSPFYAFANGDILFTDSLIKSLKKILNSTKISKDNPLMIVGRRTNVQEVTSQEANTWTNVIKTAKTRGKVYTEWAEDYFITSADYPWKDIPEVVIGRRAYDNWLVTNARKQKHVTIDATETLLALHQTTRAGNMEGHKAPNSEYNHNLLRRLYKTLHYAAGLTSCTDYYTRYDQDRHVNVLNRTIRKSCFPV